MELLTKDLKQIKQQLLNQQGPVKKDGTPDMRYKTNKDTTPRLKPTL
jgi:hypothetical protein